MKLYHPTLALVALVTLATAPGCLCFDFGEADPPPATAEPTDEISDPPWIEEVSIPDWPPPGPDTLLAVTARDDEGLSGVQFTFAEQVWVTASGTSAEVSVPAIQLGEGYGTMGVVAYDEDDSLAEQLVFDFLVDLSNPKGELVQSVVRRAEGSDILLWVGDAWVLGGATLTFQGASQTYVFEAGYPSTLGVEWDTSVVSLPSVDFPEGAGTAELLVWDAAGNMASVPVPLTLDGTPPVTTITSPPDGSAVSGVVTISVTGADENKDAVQIDVFVAGSPIATLPGPSGEVSVDVSELAKGATTIEAIARDAAGNFSAPASIDITIE